MSETTSDAPLSKKALKKAAKAERYQAFKLERRAREKQMRKEKKRVLAEETARKRSAGELDDDQVQQAKKRKVASDFNGQVVLDLGFDQYMTEKEINSLCSQLAYTYSANRNSSYPFSILCTSVEGKTKERLEAINDAAYKRWKCTEWWETGLEGLWETDADTKKQKIVYLTADSSEEIDELKPDEVYIIGALVDRNRYKNLTFDKASTLQIRHARLPIGKYISSETLPTRKVLTVNQVFEIMLKWVETRDWEEAFHCIIPKRKFGEGKGKVKGEDMDESKDRDERLDDANDSNETDEHLDGANETGAESTSTQVIVSAGETENRQIGKGDDSEPVVIYEEVLLEQEPVS